MRLKGRNRDASVYSKRMWSIVAAVAAGIVVIAVGSGILWAMSANPGEIAATNPKIPVYSPARLDYKGAYMTFSYDGNYKAHQLPATDNDLENTILSADKNYDKRLAVSVSKLKGGELTTNSAYNLRASQPTVYSSQLITVDGGSATMWTKSDGSEQTVFIPHADKIAVLSFSTTGTANNLSTEATAVVASFRWKG
jgi:hypothetical protein